MTGLDWGEVEAIFQEALEQPVGERRGLVASRCGARANLLAEVTSLLDAHDQSTGFLEPLATSLLLDGPNQRVGMRIGSYELVRVLGTGGMGTVYLGLRADGQFAHEVAIKLTRATVTDGEVAHRFADERDILAALRHPHIVTLIDAGTTEIGQAYLVMEYVEGQSLSTFVTTRRTSLVERLRLFRQICSAVHAAHQHGVVHRDLKPGNILVTDEGIPKVLDFGVAKLIDRPDRGVTRAGPFGGAPITPNYASPEQLRGQPVTTASDLYTLGVILYELVTDTRPYDVEGRPLDAALTDVLSGHTTRPSTAAGRVGSLPYAANQLRGDLDAIVLKAMRVEPEERYSSADELAADIDRFLGGRPVVAREPSLGYLMSKLVARHRVSAGVATVALAGMLVALGAALWEQQRAERARATAQAHFDTIRTMANTLIFKLGDAIRDQSPTEARQVVVAEALAYLDRLAATSTDPAVQLDLAAGFLKIGEVQGDPRTSNLGDRVGALSSARQALALLGRIDSRSGMAAEALARTVDAHRMRAALLVNAEAVTASSEALDAAERWVRIESSDQSRRALASAHFDLAVRRGWPAGRENWDAAAREFEALLAAKPDDPDRMRNVALVDKYLMGRLATDGDDAGALTHARRAAELDGRRLEIQPGNRRAMLDAAISFANLATRLADAAERLALQERSLALRAAVTAADPADEFAREVHRRSVVLVALARRDVGDAAGARARAEEAIELFDQEEVRLIDAAEVYWRALARLLLAVSEGREGRAASGCRYLAGAEADIARSQPAGENGALADAEVRAARVVLPRCPTGAVR